MTELHTSGRHSAGTSAAGYAPGDPSADPVVDAPEGVAPDEVWVPPPFEPSRPGDFVEYAAAGWEVKKSHRGLKVVLLLVLVAALAGGGWYTFLRDTGGGPAVPSCVEAHVALPAAEAKKVTVAEGGHVPAGVPVPVETPARTCTVTAGKQSAVLAVWTSESEAAYATLLMAGGWTASTVRGDVTVHANGANHQVVLTTTRDGMLLAGYGH